jgi:hypothetical protein
MLLQIHTLVVDETVQARASLDSGVVSEYAEALENGALFPPVIVFHDGERHRLADGFHRVAAAHKAGRQEIECDVRPGTRRDAALFAAGANVAHGLRRTNADKRHAVSILLRDDEWSRWSDREIARRCGVSNTLVGQVRRELSVNGSQMAERTARRGGAVYPMRTGAIGKDGPASEPEAAPAAVDAATLPAPEADLAYQCRECGEAVDREVWHCPGCGKHLLAETEACGDCEASRPAVTFDWVVVGGQVFLTPFGGLLPDLEGEEYSRLRESIRRSGIVTAVVLDEQGAVIDGRQRLRVAADLGLEPVTRNLPRRSGRDPFEAFIKLNLCRKSYTPEEREQLARGMQEAMARYAADSQRDPGPGRD